MKRARCFMGLAAGGLLAGSFLAAGPAVWRSGWTSMAKPAETFACARDLGFNALIFGGSADRIKTHSATTKAAGIESYHWFSSLRPTWLRKGMAPTPQLVNCRKTYS